MPRLQGATAPRIGPESSPGSGQKRQGSSPEHPGSGARPARTGPAWRGRLLPESPAPPALLRRAGAGQALPEASAGLPPPGHRLWAGRPKGFAFAPRPPGKGSGGLPRPSGRAGAGRWSVQPASRPAGHDPAGCPAASADERLRCRPGSSCSHAGCPSSRRRAEGTAAHPAAEPCAGLSSSAQTAPGPAAADRPPAFCAETAGR